VFERQGNTARMRWISMTLVLAAVALAGCGQSANRTAVRAVTDRFSAAVASHDGAQACAQLSQATVKQLEQDEKATCSQAVVSLGLTTARVARVQVYVTDAKVDFTNGASAFLQDTAGGWKLSALGCRPTQGDPRKHPLGCAVES
jgi:hypothetical protein